MDGQTIKINEADTAALPINKLRKRRGKKETVPLWLTISESAAIGGVEAKTIRRAIQFNHVKYKVIGNRYSVDFATLLKFLHSKTKLKNKLNQFGIGQYAVKWKGFDEEISKKKMNRANKQKNKNNTLSNLRNNNPSALKNLTNN